MFGFGRGDRTSLRGLLYEGVSWLPALGISAGLGAASLTENVVEWPFYVNWAVSTYQTIVYPLVETFVGTVPTWLIDVGAILLGVITLFSRFLFKFIGSAIVFAVVGALLVFGGQWFFPAIID